MDDQIDGQISIFELLDAGELKPQTPMIAAEDFHLGVKGWMLHAVTYREKSDWHYYMQNGRENDSAILYIITYTDRWKSVKEPWQDSAGRWGTAGEKVLAKGERYAGWYGGHRPLYYKTPTFNERIECAHQSCDYKPGIRIVDADYIVALDGPPLTDEEKDWFRRIQKP